MKNQLEDLRSEFLDKSKHMEHLDKEIKLNKNPRRQMMKRTSNPINARHLQQPRTDFSKLGYGMMDNYPEPQMNYDNRYGVLNGRDNSYEIERDDGKNFGSFLMQQQQAMGYNGGNMDYHNHLNNI